MYFAHKYVLVYSSKTFGNPFDSVWAIDAPDALIQIGYYDDYLKNIQIAVISQRSLQIAYASRAIGFSIQQQQKNFQIFSFEKKPTELSIIYGNEWYK